MSKENRFDMIAQHLKEKPLVLPADIKMQKTMTSEGNFAYVLRHQQLGELGRLVIVPHSSGKTQWVSEVVGDPDDPMTQKRKEILEPILQAFYQKADEIFGPATESLKPYHSDNKSHLIKSMVMPCEKCKATTAMLIMANADTEDQLEDYARLMFTQVKELNVPTWVVGYEKEVVVNGEKCGESIVLKMWPTREAARIMLSTELNPILDELMDTHCP